MSPALILVIVALLGVVGTGGGYWYGERIGDAAGFKRGTDEQKPIIDRMIIDHHRNLHEANEKIVDLADQMQSAKELSENERAQAQARNASIQRELVAARTDRGGLRDALDAALAAPRQPGAEIEAAFAACRERGIVASRQLDLGLQLQETLAGRAQSCAADLRSVLNAWPRAVAVPEGLGAEVMQ